MTVDELLGRLASLDVVLSVEGERILFDAPAGALTDELRVEIAAHRAELARRLSSPGTSTEIAAAPASTEPPRIDFAGWVCRRAADGTIGWEAPDVPEESRWWARSTFDALPTWPQDRSPRQATRL